MNLFNLYIKQLFHCLGNLQLVCVLGNLESVLAEGKEIHALLRDDRLQDNILCSFHYAYTSSI